MLEYEEHLSSFYHGLKGIEVLIHDGLVNAELKLFEEYIRGLPKYSVESTESQSLAKMLSNQLNQSREKILKYMGDVDEIVNLENRNVNGIRLEVSRLINSLSAVKILYQ